MKSNTLQNRLNDCWTTQDLMRRFHVTAMTIHSWRQLKALPAVVIPGDKRPTIRFIPDEVRKWARDTNTIMYEV